MIREASLGEVSFATSDHHPLVPSAPKDQWCMKRALAGSGSFTDIGIYSLNGLLWFMGEPLAALSARTWGPPGDARFAEVEAAASVQLRFHSGRLANISSGYLGDKKRIEVFGSDAVATLDLATEYMATASWCGATRARRRSAPSSAPPSSSTVRSTT
jgi:predicted dehydrogenase